MGIKLVIGCGYLGSRVAARWQQQGDRVLAVTRIQARAEEFRAQGLEPIVADVAEPASLALLGDLAPDCVLYAVGFDRQSGHSMRSIYVDGLRTALSVLPKGTGRLIYVSSTGVYGNFDGGWVDEDSPCEPERENGRVCLEAEALLESHPLAPRATILRMAGLYGPGRVPNRRALVAGEPIVAPLSGYLNLIHVDDAAAAVLAAERELDAAGGPHCLLVSDGHPARRRDYYEELARLVGAPPPQLVEPDSADPAAQRATSSKRIRNARMLAALKITLCYPDFRAGLAQIVAEESAAP